VDDAVGALGGGGVADGEDVGGQRFDGPGLAVVGGECDVGAVFVDVFLVLWIEVGDEEEFAVEQADDRGAFAAGEGVEGKFGFGPSLAVVVGGGEGHAAVDVGIFAAETEEVAVVGEDDGGVAAGGAASGVGPSLAVVGGLPDDGDGAVAVGLAAGGVGGHVDRTVGSGDDRVDGLRDVAADGCGKDGEVCGGPGDAVVVRGGPGEGRSADEAGESPEEPGAAAGLGLEFGIVPEDGGGEAGVREDGERFRHVPVFGAGAAAEDHDGLVGIVFAVGRVVEGGEEVAVGKDL